MLHQRPVRVTHPHRVRAHRRTWPSASISGETSSHSSAAHAPRSKRCWSVRQWTHTTTNRHHADAAQFSGARLIVLNGANYDPWASKLAAISAPVAPVVSAAEVTKTADGANPHLWYSPSAVTAVADAVTAELSKIDPGMQAYFTGRRSAFSTTLQPYTRLIDTIKAHAAGKSYAATEGIFNYMADALGLVNKTPRGYQQAAISESDPSPADIKAFLDALAGHRIDVLIYNTQTEGSIPDQIHDAAEEAGVPVVTATETVPQGATTFVGWQDAQLTALAKALGVAV